MPLKNRFALIIVFCLITNLLILVGFCKIYIYSHYQENFEHVSQNITNMLAEITDSDIDFQQVHDYLAENFTEENIIRDSFSIGVSLTLEASLLLLCILLVVVLFYIDREICKPLARLNDTINRFNKSNGYYTPKGCCNEINILSKNFDLMCEQIESNKQKKNELMSCIAHDLKTPLTSILGYTQRLIEPGIADPHKRLKYHQIILTKAKDIQSMVEELNTYITDEIKEVVLEEISPLAFLNRTIDQYQEELLAYEVQLITHIDLDPLLRIGVDENRLKRIFANLFSNAVYHGGKQTELTLTSFSQENKWIVRVENNGAELANGEYDRVFDLMYQGDSSRTQSQHHGKGLGLAIVQQIIHQHNGEIKAYRPLLGGFGIEFYIPF